MDCYDRGGSRVTLRGALAHSLPAWPVVVFRVGECGVASVFKDCGVELWLEGPGSKIGAVVVVGKHVFKDAPVRDREKGSGHENGKKQGVGAESNGGPMNGGGWP